VYFQLALTGVNFPMTELSRLGYTRTGAPNDNKLVKSRKNPSRADSALCHGTLSSGPWPIAKGSGLNDRGVIDM
jgi:hypothetical protein